MSIACIVIAGGKRRELIDEAILPSIIPQGFDETIVVGDHHDGRCYRYLPVPALLGSTVDALVKRDAGALAAGRSSVLVYLCDDHTLDPDFLATFQQYRPQRWDVLVPARYTVRDGQRIRLNMGHSEGYCAGHGGIFRREVIERCPWSCGPHHRNWDLLISHRHRGHGFRYEFAGDDLAIIDCEPGAEPWK